MTGVQIALLTLAVSAFGVLATWRGIAVSRNQHVNQAGFELAKRLLERVLKLESTIRTLRTGFWSDEEALWTEINSVGNDIDQAFRDGHALWGDGFAALKPALKNCVGDLRLARSKAERGSQNHDRLTDEQIDKIWQETSPFLHVSEPDPFADRIRGAIKAIEKFLKPHLRRSWWHR